MPNRVAIVWAPRALDRVTEEAQYIAADRPGVARRWVDEIFDRVDLLAGMPKQGRVVPEVGRADIREIFFGQYRVIYRVEAKRVMILTVRHTRRLFDPRETQDR